MLNWCKNHVTFSGPREVMEKFMLDSGLPDTFSCNKIRPMPEEIRYVSKYRFGGGGEGYRLSKPGEDWNNGIDLPEEEVSRLRSTYGYPDWYSWACNNWGIKWDVSEVKVMSYEEDEDEPNWYVEFYCESPWGPPEQLVDYIREQYPEINVDWFFKEPGMRISGWL